MDKATGRLTSPSPSRRDSFVVSMRIAMLAAASRFCGRCVSDNSTKSNGRELTPLVLKGDMFAAVGPLLWRSRSETEVSCTLDASRRPLRALSVAMSELEYTGYGA